ncbi:MAG: hypothetical protein ACKVP2_11435 [Burkholderiales bacterium]
MLPDETELKKLESEVSAAYHAAEQRNAPDELPSPRVDAVIRNAARAAVGKPRHAAWRVPMSVAATLVVAGSLVFLMQDNEPPFFPENGVVSTDADGAGHRALQQKAVPPVSAPRAIVLESARPSRDRPDRAAAMEELRRPVGELKKEDTRLLADASIEESPMRVESTPNDGIETSRKSSEVLASNEVELSAASSPAASPPMPASPAKSGPRLEEKAVSAAIEADAQRMTNAAPAARQADALESRQRASEPAAVAGNAAALELAEIEKLVRDERTPEATRRLKDFRKRYPGHPLPAALAALLPRDAR